MIVFACAYAACFCKYLSRFDDGGILIFVRFFLFVFELFVL